VASESARARGLVMLCDVNLGFPDATRTHTVEVARGFAGEGLDVELIARGPDPGLPGVRYRPARGGEHDRLRRLLSVNAVAGRALWRRRRTARRFYVRDSWSCFPALLVARLLRYRVVVQVDGIPYGHANVERQAPPLEWIKRAVGIATGRLANGILAVTPQIESLLVSIARVPPQRIAVIPNGVDLELFRPVARAEAIERVGLDPACRYIAFCGGFHQWTDFESIVRTLAELGAETPELRLLLIGDGDERPRIERAAAALGVRERIVITGLQHERERVRDYLAAATVTLLVYSREQVTRTSASPIKLTEYLACGRATVAVEIPGVREILEDHGAGVVVSGPEELAAAIRPLLDPDHADALGAAGRRYAERHLAWRSVVQRTLPLFGGGPA
jgi:glycosyltransferase involved in cell wall biosynthesis